MRVAPFDGATFARAAARGVDIKMNFQGTET